MTSPRPCRCSLLPTESRKRRSCCTSPERESAACGSATSWSRPCGRPAIASCSETPRRTSCRAGPWWKTPPTRTGGMWPLRWSRAGPLRSRWTCTSPCISRGPRCSSSSTSRWCRRRTRWPWKSRPPQPRQRTRKPPRPPLPPRHRPRQRPRAICFGAPPPGRGRPPRVISRSPRGWPPRPGAARSGSSSSTRSMHR